METAKRVVRKYRRNLNPPYGRKDIPIILGTLLILLSIPLVSLMTLRAEEVAPQAKATTPLNGEIIEKQTLKLLDLNSDLDDASKVKKQKILSQMEDIAKSRKERLSSIAEENPAKVLRVAYPDKVKDNLPKKVQSSIEEKVKLTGSLEVLQIDDFENNKGELKYFLKTKKKRFSLHSEDKFPEYPSGTNVEVSGVAVGEKIVLDSDVKKNSKLLAASDTTGPQKNVVILVNFQNDTSQKFTPAAARGVMFTNSNSVNNYYQESSYNKVSHSGDVFGWYTLPINRTCSQLTVLAEAVKASDADINFQNYDQIVIAHPGPCGWAGLAYIGKINVSTGDGWVQVRAAWIIDSYFNLQVVGHEIGHGFGVWHANALECGSKAISSSCSSVAYADPYDIMGNIKAGHFNGYHKEQFSWFDPSNIITVSSSGNYSVEPFETATSGPKIIKVPKGFDGSGNPITWHYLEYRQQTGFDNNLSGNVYEGALVHYAPFLVSTGDTHLIDTTPTTSSRTDSALTVGQTFSDSDAGVTIKTTNKTSTRLDVQVNFDSDPPCTRANPSVTLSPAQVMAYPGSTKAFTVSVTNNDSAGCDSSAFSLVSQIPAGWSSNFGSSQLTLNPGQNDSTSLNVTSSVSAAEDFYDVTVSATNQSELAYSGQDTSTYVVSNDLEDPTVAITYPGHQEVVSGTITVTADATDDVGVTKVEFVVEGTIRETDTTAPYTYTWDTTQDTNAWHLLSAVAYDDAGKSANHTIWAIVSNNDTQKPSIPTNLSAAVKSISRVDLTWSASTDNVLVSGYKVYRNGSLLASPSTTSYVDNTVSLGGTYKYEVSAYDLSSNESDKSTPITVAVKDQAKPSAPANLKAKVVSTTRVDLSWSVSTDNVGVTGYRIYRNGSLIKKVTGNKYYDKAVKAAKTYSYYVKAYDAAGNISNRSSIVKVTTPKPPSSGTPQGKLGDLNSDGKVNIFDLSILLTRYNTTSKLADLNNSGKVNIFDLSILLSRWGS